MIEINGQLHNAPYYLRDTGEPPVERNPVGGKIPIGLRSFFLNRRPQAHWTFFRLFRSYTASHTRLLHGMCVIHPPRLQTILVSNRA
jgi:hypothetical protein